MGARVPDLALTAKRIALIASYAPSIIQFRGPLIRAILERGHPLLAAAPDFAAPVRHELESLGVETADYPLARTGLDPRADLASLRALTDLMRSWRPDVVMGYTPKPAIYASLAASRVGVPHIVPMLTGLGYAFLPGGGAKRRLVRAVSGTLYKRALARAHAVVFHNADDAAVLRKAGCLPRDLPVHIVSGSGVDLDHFTTEPLASTENGLVFLMIARLVGYKGVGEYCEAAQRLKPRFPEADWLLVGPEERGPAGYARETLARFGDAVTYLGPADDVRPMLKRCHVYVLPSYGEGMPRTVLEALATGRPVITTDARGCRETVINGSNGSLVPIRNAAALADAMTAMLEGPELLADMGRRSRALAEERFDVNLVNKAMLAALGICPGGPLR